MKPDEYQEYDDERASGPGRGAVLAVITALLCLTVVGAWWLRETDSNRDLVGYAGRSGVLRAPVNGEPQTVGTTGVVTTEPVGTSGGDAVDSPAVIKELETITGAVDGHELVGRRVNLAVPVQETANDNAFWVGTGDNRLLVVVRRDRRDGVQRQEGTVATHGITPVHAGETATVVGRIQKLPQPEEMYSWGLTATDKKQLADRPIYIRADTVTADGRSE
jgi:hypothetical protein